jgi:SsrA-binding protein
MTVLGRCALRRAIIAETAPACNSRTVWYNSAVEQKAIATNRKAYHDYFVEESYEAGLVLTGTEIKSIRAGKINLRDSFARVDKGEIWVENIHVSPYTQGNRENPPPVRRRKLLMHKDEIRRLGMKVQAKGLTLIPLRVYIKGNRAKLELGLAKGKRLYDKREAIAKKDAERELERDWHDKG